MVALASEHQHYLRRYTRALDRTFRANRDKYAASRASEAILQDMAADRRALEAVLGMHLASAKTLNTLAFPALSLDIEVTPHYGLVANCFFPLPTGDTDLTVNSIHHHGEMLLTTVTTFGPGYEHWRFEEMRPVPSSDDVFETRLIDRMTHRLGHMAFVDALMPHAVMFPESLSITLALWTSRRGLSWRDRLKRLPMFKGNEKKLRLIAARLGLGKALELKQPTYLDYYPVDGQLKGMRDRIQFARGPNRDFLCGLFNVVQRTQNDQLVPVIERALREVRGIDHPELVRELAQQLRRGEPIEHRFSAEVHDLVPHMNFKAALIEQALDRSGARAA